MTTLTIARRGRDEGQRRKAIGHAQLADRRDWLIRRAPRVLLIHLLGAGIATADGVAESIGPSDPDIDPHWRCGVPRPLAAGRHQAKTLTSFFVSFVAFRRSMQCLYLPL
jgi:hypothetical protein